MNTNRFLTKVLDEKLQDNDVNIIKMITKCITCEICNNTIVMNENKTCGESCYELYKIWKRIELIKEYNVLREALGARPYYERCVRDTIKTIQNRINIVEGRLRMKQRREERMAKYEKEQKELLARIEAYSDSDDELTSISDFDSDFEGYDSDEDENQELLDELESML